MRRYIAIWVLLFIVQVLQAQTDPVNLNCETNIAITSSQLTSGKFLQGDSYGLSCLNESVRGVWFSVAGDGKYYNLVLGSGTGQLQYQFFSGDCALLQCLGQGNGYVPLLNDSTYYLLIYEHTQTVIEDTFEFYFEEAFVPDYDNCDTAPALNCGESITLNFDLLSQSSIEQKKMGWFQAIANNKIATLQTTSWTGEDWILSVHTLPCISAPTYVAEETPLRWISAGASPTLFSVFDSIGLVDSVQFNLTCTDINPGQICNQPFSLVCEDIIADTLWRNAIADFNHPEVVYQWFLIQGDSTQHEIEVTQTSDHALSVELYYSSIDPMGGCADSVLESKTLQQAGQKWRVSLPCLPGYRYYLVLSGTDSTAYQLLHSCDSIQLSGLNCLTANTVVCGDSLDGGHNIPGLPLGEAGWSAGGGNWFKWDSLAALPNWIATDTLQNLSYDIYAGGCDSLTLVYSYNASIEEGSVIQIVGQDSIDYYLVLRSADETQDTVTLMHGCGQTPCQIATTVNCGDTLALLSDTNTRLDLSSDIITQPYRQWINFVGTGNLLTWNKVGQGMITVYTGSCANLTVVPLNINNQSAIQKLRTQIGEDYYLVWESTDYDTLALNLHFECEEVDSTDTCAQALLADCGIHEYIFTNEGAMPEDTSSFCGPVFDSKWLRIKGSGQLITLWGSAMTLYRGSCDSLQCLGTVDHSARFLTLSDTSYNIAIATDGTDTTVINLECTPPASNSGCESATLLQCDSSYTAAFKASLPATWQSESGVLWYQLAGDGNLWKISTTADNASHWSVSLAENCESTGLPVTWVSEADTAWAFQLYTQAGIEYILKIESDSLYDGSFGVDCTPLVPGLDCGTAIDLICGDTLDYASGQRLSFGDLSQSAWYKVTTQNSGLSLSMLGDTSALRAIWLKGSNCDDLSEVLGLHSLSDDLSVYADSIENLYLVLGLPEGVLDTTSLLLHCETPEVAHTCESAVPLHCGIASKVYATHTRLSPATPCVDEMSSNWLRLEGDGQWWTAIIDSGSISGHLYLYQGNCGDLFCLDTLRISGQSNQPSFLAAVGQSYYVQYIADEAGQAGKINWACRPYYANNSCDLTVPISCGDTLTGNTWLAPTETENGCNANGPALYYTFTGNGQYYRLHLLEGVANFNLIEKDCQTGRCLLSQKLGSGRNSILIASKMDQEYHLRISAPDSVLFRFALECFDPNTNQSCFDAAPGECASQYRCDLQSPVGFQLGHPCIGLPRMQHWYYLESGNQALVELIPDVASDSFSILLIRGNCSEYECIAQYSSNDPKIIFHLEDSYEYYISIYGNIFSENTALFSLQCGDAAVNDTCGAAIELNCPQTVNVPLYLATKDENPVCHQGESPSLWYKVAGSGQGLNLQLTGASPHFEGQMVIYSGPSCSALNCIYTTTIKAGENKEHRWLAAAGQSYWIGFYSNDAYNAGWLDMELSCFDQAANDTCVGALPLVDGNFELKPYSMTSDTVSGCGVVAPLGEWYTWAGDGKSVSITNNAANDLKLALFSGSCGALSCLGKIDLPVGEQWDVLTQPDRDYFVLIQSIAGLQTTGEKFNVRFYTPIPNDNCPGALPFNCGQLIAVRNNNFTEDFELYPSCDTLYPDKLWYTFTGDGSIRTLKYIVPDVDGSVVFAEDCSNGCFYSSEFYASLATEFSFSSVPDKKYLIGIGTKSQPNNKRIRVQMDCVDGYHHVAKESALPLICGKYELDYSQAKINLLNTCSSNNLFVQLYYSFTGDGSDLVLVGSPNPGAFFKVVNEDCISVHDFAFGGKIFTTEAGKQYYFLISYFPGIQQLQQEFSIEYRCDVATEDLPLAQPFVSYPNPSNGSTSFYWQGNDVETGAELCLIDVAGRVVRCENTTSLRKGLIWKIPADQKLIPGVYHARLRTEKAVMSTTILVVE